MSCATKVVHVTAHTGGGVGTVLKAIITESMVSKSYEHTVVTLEQSNEFTRIWTNESGVVLCENGSDHREQMFLLLEQADIVHVHWWNHPLMNQFLFATNLPPVRTILWSHVNGHAVPQSFFAELIQFPDLFVVATPFSLETKSIQNLADNARKNRIRYIHSSAGIPSYAPRRFSKPESCSFAYIGTVDYCKMSRSIFSIWREAAIADSTLHLYGGSAHEQIREELSRTMPECAVEFHGIVSNLAEIYADLSVLVYPLQPDHYGTGEQVLIEAMACGVVPVVFANGCEQHIVEHGVTGICVHSEQEFSEALRMLANDPEYRNRLAENAMNQTQERYSLRRSVEQWHSLYEELLRFPRRKIEPLITDQSDLGGDLLKLSMSGTVHGVAIFEQLISGELSDRNGYPEALFAQTRGTPIHYYHHFPFSEICRKTSKTILGLRDSDCVAANSIHPCPVCGSNQIDQKTELTFALFDDLNLSGKSPMVRCESCGMIFHDNDVTEEQLDHYYRTNDYYFAASTGGSGGISDDDQWRYESIIEKAVPYLIKNDPVVVDLGCGKGGFPLWLSRRGFSNCYGVEKSHSCRDSAESGFLMTDSLESLPVNHVDLFVLSHVMEHQLNPSSLCKQIAPYCHESTVIYCEVPNGAAYLGSTPQWEKCYFEHLSHFTADSLTNLWNRAGFELISGGVRPFSRTDSADSSLYLILKKSTVSVSTNLKIAETDIPQFDRTQIESTADLIRDHNERAALWGISQYAMLLLGMTDLHVDLFDSSPAKIGRSIHGKSIDSADNLFKSISLYDRICIPRSPYRDSMVQKIRNLSSTIKISVV